MLKEEENFFIFVRDVFLHTAILKIKMNILSVAKSSETHNNIVCFVWRLKRLLKLEELEKRRGSDVKTKKIEPSQWESGRGKL